jgi:hypothetical protein
MVELATKTRDEFYAETEAKLTAEKKGALLKKLNKVEVVKPEVDRESGDETGEMLIRAGMKHHIEIKNGPKAGTVVRQGAGLLQRSGRPAQEPAEDRQRF